MDALRAAAKTYLSMPYMHVLPDDIILGGKRHILAIFLSWWPRLKRNLINGYWTDLDKKSLCDYFYNTVPLISFFPVFFLFHSQLRLLLTSQERAGSTSAKRNMKNNTFTYGRTSGWLPMSLLIDTQSRSCRSWLTWPPALMASAFLSSKSKRIGRNWRPIRIV